MNLVDYYAGKLGKSVPEIMDAAAFMVGPDGPVAFRWDVGRLGAVPSAEDLAIALGTPDPAPTPDQLAAYAKMCRDATEAAGIIVNDVAIASDTDSQNRVNNAYNGMIVAGVTSIPFKSGSGFVALTLDQLKAIGTALFSHTQACFAAEDQVDAGLSAVPPTITTFAEIDALFAGVKSVF